MDLEICSMKKYFLFLFFFFLLLYFSSLQITKSKVILSEMNTRKETIVKEDLRVGKLKEILSKYNDDDFVIVSGTIITDTFTNEYETAQVEEEIYTPLGKMHPLVLKVVMDCRSIKEEFTKAE